MLHIASAFVPGSLWRRRLGRRSSRLKARTEARWAHAYRDREAVTLCALPLELLDVEEFAHTDFAELPARVRCELCALLAERR